MKAGRELDALVAEKVMNYSVSTNFSDYPTFYRAGNVFPIPHYSTDIAAAWEVVEKVSTKRFDFTLTTVWDYEEKMMWEAVFSYSPKLVATALTAPHAICLAALKAVGELEDK